MLGSVKEQFLVLEDSDSLTIFKETDFKSPGGEDCYADECVRRSVNDGYSTEDRAEVGEMSAEKARAVSELNVERLVPSLWSRVKVKAPVQLIRSCPTRWTNSARQLERIA